MAGTNRNKWMLAGGVAAAGMAAIYFLDREHGSARRIALASKARRLRTEVGEGVVKSARDSWHHLAGTARKAWSNLGGRRVA